MDGTAQLSDISTTGDNPSRIILTLWLISSHQIHQNLTGFHRLHLLSEFTPALPTTEPTKAGTNRKSWSVRSKIASALHMFGIGEASTRS